jgi:hypothetical protein
MLGLILAFALQAAQPGIKFTTVATGTASFVDAERTVVIRTASEWDALWKEHAPTRPRPTVDFAKETVVGVFLGSRPTAGFSVAITAIRTASGVTTVEYAERRPNPDLMVAQVLTSPFHLVRIPTTAGTIEFKKGA